LNFTRNKWKIGLATAVVVAAAGWFLFSGDDGEPSYHGRKLSEWIVRYGEAETNSPQRLEAAGAIQHIGTNGLAHVMELIQYESGPWREGMKEVLGDGFRDRRLEAARFASMYWFGTVGPDARSAIPKLLQILQGQASSEVKRRAEWALGTIGDQAIPPLVSALTNSTCDVRLSIVRSLRAIGRPGTNASQSLSVLFDCLNDGDARIARQAAWTIGEWRLAPARSVPVLVRCLDSPDWRMRSSATYGLGEFGEVASPAVTNLLLLLTDPEADVRIAATNALYRIAPGELGKVRATDRPGS
jgi:hypothetical protein